MEAKLTIVVMVMKVAAFFVVKTTMEANLIVVIMVTKVQVRLHREDDDVG